MHYVYGVFDHLLATEVDSTGSGSYDQTERYVLDISPEAPKAGVPGTALAQPLLKFDGNQNLTARYLEALDRIFIFAEGGVISLTQGDTVVFDLVDNLGTTRDQVTNSGTLANHIVYSEFGQVTYQSNSALIPWAGFGGGHFSPATAEVNDLNRWYDPTIGKWLSDDPSGFDAGDGNLSRYGMNSPAYLADPTGLNAAGASGGVAAGAGIGSVMGLVGSGAVVVTIAAITLTPIGLPALTVIPIGAGIGALTGAVEGGYYGSVEMTLSAGAATAASKPQVYYVPLLSGSLWAASAYKIAGPPAFWEPYVKFPWWWPWP